MSDNNDHGYITILLKKEEDGHHLCEIGFTRNPGEEALYVDYENGTIFINFNDGKKIIGTYETNPGPYGAKVFDYPSNRVIGVVGGELIQFQRKAADPSAGVYIDEQDCLAYYTQAGRITAMNLLTTFGLIEGSSLGGAAAFVAVFYNYNFISVFRDYYLMEDGAFKNKYASYLNPLGW